MVTGARLRIAGIVLTAAAALAAAWAVSQWAALRCAPGAVREGKPARPVEPRVNCTSRRAGDQDDMCIWLHPADPARSTVIASDKAAGKLFVYDLSGRVVQRIDAAAPGNIDIRYGFPLGAGKVDVVAFNQRTRGYRVRVYAVAANTGRLRRVDNGRITTGPNYGGTLFRSPNTGKLYFLTTSYSAGVEQYELFDDGTGKVGGRKVRSWKLGLSEGAVGDDEAGKVYVCEESKGVWEIGGEPTDPAPGKLVIRVGRDGLTADVEGIALYHLPGGKGYLLVSSQGNSTFKVYRRSGGHEYVGTFAVAGVGSTDGIDVTNAALAPAFPKGLFACHNGRRSPCPVVLTPWERIARSIRPALKVDTSWNPRKKPVKESARAAAK